MNNYDTLDKYITEFKTFVKLENNEELISEFLIKKGYVKIKGDFTGIRWGLDLSSSLDNSFSTIGLYLLFYEEHKFKIKKELDRLMEIEVQYE